MIDKPKSSTLTTGFAIFSMFFGAGNIFFPLALGYSSESNYPYAIAGLILTAVGVPLIGLIAMTLFNGNYKHFFERIGKVPGFFVAILIMGLIGPFGAFPRIITLTHSTVNVYWPDLISLPVFSILSCILVFILTFKKYKIVDLLGYYMMPLLLIPLLLIIGMGWMTANPVNESNALPLDIFIHGMKVGYETMDLFAAFFFSSVVLLCLERPVEEDHHKHNYRIVIFTALKASLIAAFLLGAIYVGFCSVAAFHSEALMGLERDQILGKLALLILGPYASFVAISAIFFAGITTAIALAAVFAEFLHKDLFQDRISYIPCLAITVLIACLISTLSFQGIMAFLAPILHLLYPSMIVLSIMNLGHKLWHWKIVKTPVAITFLISLYTHFN